MEINSVYELRDAFCQKHPDSHYFDHDTLKFFGESLSTMRLLKNKAMVIDSLGEEHECYVLSRLQKKHPMGPRRTYAYFDCETLEDVIV